MSLLGSESHSRLYSQDLCLSKGGLVQVHFVCDAPALACKKSWNEATYCRSLKSQITQYPGSYSCRNSSRFSFKCFQLPRPPCVNLIVKNLTFKIIIEYRSMYIIYIMIQGGSINSTSTFLMFSIQTYKWLLTTWRTLLHST